MVFLFSHFFLAIHWNRILFQLFSRMFPEQFSIVTFLTEKNASLDKPKTEQLDKHF